MHPVKRDCTPQWELRGSRGRGGQVSGTWASGPPEPSKQQLMLPQPGGPGPLRHPPSTCPGRAARAALPRSWRRRAGSRGLRALAPPRPRPRAWMRGQQSRGAGRQVVGLPQRPEPPVWEAGRPSATRRLPSHRGRVLPALEKRPGLRREAGRGAEPEFTWGLETPCPALAAQAPRPSSRREAEPGAPSPTRLIAQQSGPAGVTPAAPHLLSTLTEPGLT